MSQDWLVRVHDVGISQPTLELSVSSSSSVQCLKEAIRQQHAKHPEVGVQRLVLGGKLLNDNSAVLADVIASQPFAADPASGLTVHLVITNRAPGQAMAQSSQVASSSQAKQPSAEMSQPQQQQQQQQIHPAPTDPLDTCGGDSVPEVDTTCDSTDNPGAANGVDVSASASPSAQPDGGFHATGKADDASQQQGTGQAAAATQAHLGASDTGAAQMHAMPMHPIMAAAYNAAYDALTRGSDVALSAPTVHAVPMPLNMPPVFYPIPAMHAHGGHAAPPVATGALSGQAQASPQLTQLLSQVAAQHRAANGAAPQRMRVFVSRGWRAQHGHGDLEFVADPVAAAQGQGIHGRMRWRRGRGVNAGAHGQDAALGGARNGVPRARVFAFNIRINPRRILQTAVALFMFYINLPLDKFLWVLLAVVLHAFQVHALLRRWLGNFVQIPVNMHGMQRAAAPVAAAPAHAGQAGMADGDAGNVADAARAHVAEDVQQAAGPVLPDQNAGAAATPASRVASFMRALGVAVLSFFLSLFPQFNMDDADADAIAAAQAQLDGQGAQIEPLGAF